MAAGNDRGYRFEVLNYIWLALVLLAVALSAWTDHWKELTDGALMWRTNDRPSSGPIGMVWCDN